MFFYRAYSLISCGLSSTHNPLDQSDHILSRVIDRQRQLYLVVLTKRMYDPMQSSDRWFDILGSKC